MNFQFSDLNNELILFSPIYMVLLIFLLVYISNKILIKDKVTSLLYGGVGLALSMILFFDTIFHFNTYFPDTNLYNSIISGILIPRIEFRAFSIVYGFRYLSAIPRFLSLEYPFLYIFINIFILNLGLMFIWRAWINYRQGLVSIQSQRIFILSSSFYPLSIAYSITTLRESYFIFSLGIFLMGLTNKKNLKKILFTIIGAIMVVILRKPYILFVLVVIILRLVLDRKYILIKYRIKIILVFSPLLYFLISFISKRLLGLSLMPETLAKFRTDRFLTWGSSNLLFPAVNWDTWIDVIRDFPLIIIQFILAPLPITVHINPLPFTLYFIDSILVILLIMILVYLWKKIVDVYFWIFIPLIFIILTAMFECFVLGAPRHRYPAIMLFLPILATQLSAVYQNLRNNDKKQKNT